MSADDFRLVTSDEMADLFGILLDRLAARDVVVEAYVIGGVAMAVHLGRTQLTPDVDGLFLPEAEVLEEARAMAAEFGLDPNWVNSRAFSFMSFDPKGDANAVEVEIRGHKVMIASKRTLLAMKIAASRPKDRNDTNRLIADLGMWDADEVVSLLREVFGEYSMSVSDDAAELRLMVDESLRRAKFYVEREAAQVAERGQPRHPAGSGSHGGEFGEKQHSVPEVNLPED